jgi:hypothetical protein
MATTATSWKSTVSGILSFVMATAGVLTSFAAAQMIADPSRSKTWIIITIGCTLASALGKAWIGLLTTDADKITDKDVAKATGVAEAKSAAAVANAKADSIAAGPPAPKA